MTLNELKNPPEIKQFKDKYKNVSNAMANSPLKSAKWSVEVKKIMEKYGLKRLGQGISGTVFSNDKLPYVVKLFRNDMGYESYLDIIESLRNMDYDDYSGNPFVPRLRGKPMRLNPSFNIVRMEKLKPFPRNGYDLVTLIRDLIRICSKSGFTRAQDFLNSILHPEQTQDKPSSFGSYLNAERLRTTYYTQVKFISNHLEAFYDLANNIESYTGSNKIDLHMGNVMMRGEIPVIVDPLVSRELLTKESYDLNEYIENDLPGVAKDVPEKVTKATPWTAVARFVPNIVSNLKDKGYKMIAYGGHGVAFWTSVKNEVVKIMLDDKSAGNFLAWCEKNKQNPYLPKIIQGPIQIHPRVHGVRMEELTPVNDIGDVFEVVQKLRKINFMLRGDYGKGKKVQEELESIKQEDPNLYELAAYLHSARKTGSIDLAPTNIMLRGTQPVFIDPITGG